MCRVSWNHAKYRTNVGRMEFDKSCITQMTFKVIHPRSLEMAWIDKPYDTTYYYLLVVCSNYVSIL